jgi:hypothetical protein
MRILIENCTEMLETTAAGVLFVPKRADGVILVGIQNANPVGPGTVLQHDITHPPQWPPSSCGATQLVCKLLSITKSIKQRIKVGLGPFRLRRLGLQSCKMTGEHVGTWKVRTEHNRNDKRQAELGSGRTNGVTIGVMFVGHGKASRTIRRRRDTRRRRTSRRGRDQSGRAGGRTLQRTPRSGRQRCIVNGDGCSRDPAVVA